LMIGSGIVIFYLTSYVYHVVLSFKFVSTLADGPRTS
jgi:hypothetical protein